MDAKVLFICGSLNQTTIMHKIARQLGSSGTYFTPYFAEGLLKTAADLHLADFSILGGQHKAQTLNYLRAHNLPMDDGNQRQNYDLVVTGSDLVIPESIMNTRVILVQEGMLEKPNISYELARRRLAPRWIANTAMTGLSGQYDRFCVGSEGYRRLFVNRGAEEEKLVVTGIPNFDDAEAYQQNDFPEHDFILVATSSIRETMKYDNRMLFLQKAKTIAGKRKVIFKLHPNENYKRATREIRHLFPDAPILTTGNLHEMIANCSVFIAQNSSAIFTALALGKEVYSDLDPQEMKKLLPVQNKGRSASLIAEECKRLLKVPLDLLKPKRQDKWDILLGRGRQPVWKLPAWLS